MEFIFETSSNWWKTQVVSLINMLDNIENLMKDVEQCRRGALSAPWHLS